MTVWLEDHLDDWADWGLRRLGALQDWLGHRRNLRWRAAHPKQAAEHDRFGAMMLQMAVEERYAMGKGMVQALVNMERDKATITIPKLGTLTEATWNNEQST